MPEEPKPVDEPSAEQSSDESPPELRRLIGRVAAYGVSRTAVEALLAGRGLLLAGILGPELFGVWTLFRIGLRYLSFAGLGLLRGLEVEVSRSSRKLRAGVSEAPAWGKIAAGYTFLLYGVLSALAAIAWALRDGHAADMALLGIAVGLLLDRLWNYGIAFLRTSGGLRRFAVLELLQAALQVVVCVSLALRWGLPGAFVGFATANLLGIALFVGRVPLMPTLEPRRVLRLIRIGFPVSLMGILTATLATVDRLLVGALVGLGGLGVYAFAVSISELGVSFATVVRTVIIRDVYSEQASSAEANPLILDRALSAYATFGPPIAGLVALALPPLVALTAQDYQSAAAVAQLLLFAGLIQGLINVAVVGIVGKGRQNRLPPLAIAAVCLNGLLTLSALRFGLGLEGVAVAAFVTRLIHAGAIIIVLMRQQSVSVRLSTITKFLVPAVWCAVAVYTISRLFPGSDITTLMSQLLAYTVALALFAPVALSRRGPHRL